MSSPHFALVSNLSFTRRCIMIYYCQLNFSSHSRRFWPPALPLSQLKQSSFPTHTTRFSLRAENWCAKWPLRTTRRQTTPTKSSSSTKISPPHLNRFLRRTCNASASRLIRARFSLLIYIFSPHMITAIFALIVHLRFIDRDCNLSLNRLI